ncbi:HNH endonuclease signature motif containing protein [Planotetraspora silvatica]|uniref:HNH endonuclease signature motif containing protein n=1 Tax=Planotetraspora silvatica TaxID=234614 RepID=UPI0031DDEFA5
MPCGPEWWAEVAARARSWSSDGTSALKVSECPEEASAEAVCPEEAFDGVTSVGDACPEDAGPWVASEDGHPEGARHEGARPEGTCPEGSDSPVSEPGVSSWGLVAGVEAAVSGLVVGGVPESAGECLAEVEVLVGARDRLIAAVAARVGRVHGAGEARAWGHGSTRMWLRGGCGMDGGSAGRLLTLAVELARLPVVRARFAAGTLSEGRVYAICVAVAGLTDEQVGVAEPILVGLADQAGPAEVARAGRFLREILDPGSAGKDGDADFGRRFLVVRPTGSGGVEGEFRLPREAAARLRAWLDTFARPGVEGDERALRVRNADALIALLESKVTTELLVVVPAASLPDDHPANSACTDPDGGDAADASDSGAAKAGGDARAGGKASDDNATSARGRGRGGGGRGEGGHAPNRTAPGLLLATGQLLSQDDINRLARTSSLIRMVMDADGQVLDMGRAVRLATGAQRRAVFARYATCWIDGCPLPATLCQIDHADNWVDGGMTDLRLLGPACQFHNRDRYRHPDRYQRRREGKDRWAYTYTGRRHRRPRTAPGKASDRASDGASGGASDRASTGATAGTPSRPSGPSGPSADPS